MSNTPHVNQIVMGYLLTQSSVTALTGTGDDARIYAVALPSSEESEHIDETIVVRKMSEMSMFRHIDRSTTPIVTADVEILCFGPTIEAADTLARTVDDVLDHMSSTSVTSGETTLGTIVLSHKQPTNEQTVEPETTWDVVRTAYRITVQKGGT